MPARLARLAGPARRAFAALALALLGTSCSLLPYRRPVLLIASDPPGATIVVNGADSGWVTPCNLDLDVGRSHTIELRRPGYEPSIRLLEPDGDTWVILWKEMYNRDGVWRFPLWLGISDFLIPVKRERFNSPARLYVELHRITEA